MLPGVKLHHPGTRAAVLNCTEQDATQLAMGNLNYCTSKHGNLLALGKMLCVPVFPLHLFMPTILRKPQFMQPSGDYGLFKGKGYREHLLCALYYVCEVFPYLSTFNPYYVTCS